jgi:hypothetical protein
MSHANVMKLVAECKGFLKNRNDGCGIVIGCDAVDGQVFASNAFMDQHQLASRFRLILVPALFHGQPYGFHRLFARGQAVTRDIQIEMTRPQAVRAVVAVVDTGDQMRAGNNGMTMRASKISEGSGAGSHSSSRRRI